MDRIRKALDLAREQRFDSRPKYTTAVPPPVEQTPPVRYATSIVYSQTQVFQPDPVILEAHRIINPAGTDPAAGAFRMLRTQVLQRMGEHNWRSLAILSPGTEDGKTTTAINLAVSLANDHHHTVLLVDCDLKRPSIGSSLGIAPEYGVNDILQGSAGIEQALYHPAGFERLVILPARAALENSSEFLSGPRGRDFVDELRNRYPERIVLFDLPPVLGADDALAFLPLVECGLVVASEGATRREDLLRCMELLRRTPIVGTVLNRASDVVSGYG